MRRSVVAVVLLCACASVRPPVVPGPRAVLVAIDGTRWQEVFGGADPALVTASVPAEWQRGSPEEKRRALMPFLWKTVAAHGQLFGNRARGSRVLLANPYHLSYPGYHEMLCGFSSPLITGNRRIPNPDVTVLAWLEQRRGFGGAVSAYASWDVFDAILDRGGNGVLVDTGDWFSAQTRPPWDDAVFDTFVFRRALQHLRDRHPRVLFIGLGDTDEWAHAGDYARYLEAIHQSDGWLRALWDELQASPVTRDRTTLLVTTDHGRGDGPRWRGHGGDYPGSEAVWVAALGPGIAPLGERQGHPPLTLAQVARTLAALVGEDFAEPRAAPPLPLR
jgi:hypothetical protein